MRDLYKVSGGKPESWNSFEHLDVMLYSYQDTSQADTVWFRRPVSSDLWEKTVSFKLKLMLLVEEKWSLILEKLSASQEKFCGV
jgi:hypothetical protein